MGWKTYSVAGILWILALGGTLQGFETSSMAVFISADQFKAYFNNPGAIYQGIIGGAHPIGAFIGCWIAGLLSDRFGRIVTMQSGSFLWVVGSVLSILVQDLYMLIGGRALKGIAVGVFSSILPVYVSEVIPANKRGLATSIMQWCLTWGILIMFYLSYLCSFIDGAKSFRIAWGIETAPGGILFILSFLLPESPKWYASRAKWQEASKILEKLESKASKGRRMSTTDQVRAANKEQSSNLNAIEGVLDSFEAKSTKCSYADLFRKDLRRHLFIGVITQATTQLSGIGVLMYYLIFICEMVGLTGDVKILSASIQYVVNVLFTIFPILWLDKMRRKDVMVYGASSLGLCIAAIGSIMGYYGHSVPPVNGNESVVWEITGAAGSLCLALCFLFVAIFASTLSCAAWLYTNEIFPDRAKSKGSAICMSVSWLLNFALTFLAPLSLKHLKWGTFCIFGALSIIGALVIGFTFPETYGLNDDQISNLFNSDRVEEVELEDQSKENRRALSDEGEEPLQQTSLPQSSNPFSSKPSARMVQTVQTTLPPPLPNNSQPHSTTTQSTQHHEVDASPVPQSRKSFENGSLKRGTSFRSSYKLEQDVSPFLKKKGAPFETDSGAGTGEELGSQAEVSTASEHYYNGGPNGTPFLNFYNDSPFK